jgi:hypothetical protein
VVIQMCTEKELTVNMETDTADGILWTVVRFPNGSWSYGGKPSSPEYALCEIWQIIARSPKEAVKKAQAKRSRDRKRKGTEIESWGIDG